MMSNSGRPAFAGLIYIAGVFCVGLYFTFAAVQGDMGLFRRVEIKADRDALAAQLDLDLLDQQARDVLGLMRSDEIVIR